MKGANILCRASARGGPSFGNSLTPSSNGRRNGPFCFRVIPSVAFCNRHVRKNKAPTGGSKGLFS